MNFFSFTLILIFLIKLGQSRLLLETDFQKVEYGVLERGKPIRLDQNYENVEINGITGTLYADSLSELQNVKILSISHNQINEIEKGALCAPPNVRALVLDFYETEEPPVLTKDIFDKCENIEELVLGFSKLKRGTKAPKVEEDALEGLNGLKELTIRWYNITHLTKNFLKLNRNSLINLNILECNIEEVDGDALDGFGNLEELVVFHNRELSRLPKNLLKSSAKLKVLNLAHNGIRDLSWDEFEGLSSLKELILTDNQIASFDVEKIARNLPNLEKLSIDQNSLSCKELKTIAAELKKKLHHLSEVTYKFEPAHAVYCDDVV